MQKWSEQEDARILTASGRRNKRKALREIATELPDRTYDAIVTRYYNLIKAAREAAIKRRKK